MHSGGQAIVGTVETPALEKSAKTDGHATCLPIDNSFRVVAQHNAPAAYREFWERDPIVLLGDEPLVPLARLATSKSVVQMADLATEQGYIERHPRVVALVEGARARTMLLVPMLKERRCRSYSGLAVIRSWTGSPRMIPPPEGYRRACRDWL